MRYAVYYMKPDYFSEGVMGFNWGEQRNTLPDPLNLSKTHVFLANVDSDNPEELFKYMQADIWSPNGEARDLIKSKGLHHTSMSVGDIAVEVVTGIVRIVTINGFYILYAPLPEGVIQVNFDDPAELHRVIHDAVGD